MLVRPAIEADLAACTEIYNHYVEHTIVTFDAEPYTPETCRPWFDQFQDGGPHRLFVAEDETGVLGYASSTRHRPKRGYDSTAETTAYVAPAAVGRRIGRALYERLLAMLADEDIHRAVAGIALPNDASIALHERLGFQRIGVYTEVGRKLGRYVDVVWYERNMP